MKKLIFTLGLLLCVNGTLISQYLEGHYSVTEGQQKDPTTYLEVTHKSGTNYTYILYKKCTKGDAVVKTVIDRGVIIYQKMKKAGTFKSILDKDNGVIQEQGKGFSWHDSNNKGGLIIKGTQGLSPCP